MNRVFRSCRFGLARTHIITIAGWSPGVRALATGQPLPCGCLVGLYHTWSENVVAVIDAVGDHCRQHHDINLVLCRRQLRECPFELSNWWDRLNGGSFGSADAVKTEDGVSARPYLKGTSVREPRQSTNDAPFAMNGENSDGAKVPTVLTVTAAQ